MKQSDLLSVTSILSVLLLALHISQDIVFGFDRAGLNHLVGVAILLVVVCGAVLLRERRSGKVIMLLGGVMAAAMLPLHMRNGLRPEFLEKSGALLFIWTLYVLGVTGAFSVILAIQALRGRRVASWRSCELNRWLPLVKWFLAIPHFVVLSIQILARMITAHP
jgi:hypothetical protein